MFGHMLVLAALLCVWAPGPSRGYSTGGPEGACSSLMPSHGVGLQRGSPPYTITTSSTQISAGADVTATITGSKPFKGFFIRMKQGDTYVDGEFIDNGGNKDRCSKTGVTHRNPQLKSSVRVVFRLGPGLTANGGNPTFTAAVVEQKSLIWRITSSEMRVVANSSMTPQPGTSVTPGPGQPTNQGNRNDDDEDDDDDKDSSIALQNPGVVAIDSECGKTKGCFHDCHGGGTCTFLVAWEYQPLNESVLFNFLYQTTSSTDQWIALGFSRDALMGEDSVVECVMDRGEVLVKTSYNTGKFNEYPDDKHAAMSDYKGSVNDGVLACMFTRKLSYPREPRVFDLHDSYYLMVASGEAVSGNKFPHSYEKLPLVSARKISVKQVSMASKGVGPLYPMVKTHGTAMTLAWMLFASIGVFISRHGRAMFNYSRPNSVLVWYHVHRFCMAMTAFLTCSGFVLILVESQGYSQIAHTSEKRYRALHPPLGMLLVILTVVNPLMALFRPDKGSPSRSTFKWTHWAVGMFAWILAIALLAIGLDLPKSQADLISVYAVFAFAGYQLVMEILVRSIPYCLGNKNGFDLHMANFSTNEVPSVTGSGIAPDKEAAARHTEAAKRRENTIKSSILVLHMLISACFAVGVVYFLLRKPVEYITSGGSQHEATSGKEFTVAG
ncbi:hypothetical protein RRG08_047905 [Elysia crispata]|uniref:Ferric-chelate reductase 1 n=1 Tax=Elysia crispata TaxID=231223 RepID=A0AAE0ZMK4_9GAST|nr:hypothetical protein RRG08_047905 [Elysia crispata]